MKMVMTGAICVVTPGSPAQIAVAMLVMLLYLLVVLKAAPYESDLDDLVAVATNFALLTTLFVALLLVTDDQENPNFDPSSLGVLMICCNVCVILLEFGILLLFECNLNMKIRTCLAKFGVQNEKQSVKISPIPPKKQTVTPSSRNGPAFTAEEESNVLRSWGRSS